MKIVFRITSERFTVLARDIGRLFPGENPSTYHSPYSSGSGKHINPSGKLFFHYCYLKGTLTKAGLLKSANSRQRLAYEPSGKVKQKL